MNKFRHFFRPAPATEQRYSEDSAYAKRLRWSVFFASTIGYGLYYVCRLSFNVIKKPLINEGLFTESELGLIGSALFFSYAAGKLINGFLADRVNIKRFFAVGLFVSAIVNLLLSVNSLFWIFVMLWGVNGWVQSVGSPACVVGLSRWYTDKNRGSFYGFWSTSHNIGEAITFVVIAFIISVYGWRWGFEAAGWIGMIGVLFIYIFMHDSPASKGLPAIVVDQDATKSVSATQREVLRNPYVWILAFSSACMYISRYAVNSWGIFYLEFEKGYTTIEASSIISVSPLCGVVGTACCGWISDKFFKSSRNLPALLFGIGNTLSIALFVFVPKGFFAVDILSMVLFGLCIGALICYLGGLMAVDIVPKKASGAALGIVGIASYLGAGVQDILSGSLIGGSKTVANGLVAYDFSAVRYFWISAAAVSLLLCATLWRTKNKTGTP